MDDKSVECFTLTGGLVFVRDRLCRLNVVIKNGKIHALTQHQTDGRIIKLQSFHVVLPGFIELHAHLRTPGDYRDINLATELRAALKGGYHTVCCMANTTPPLDNPATITRLKTAINRLGSPVQVRIWAALSEQLLDRKLVDRTNLPLDVVGFSDDGCSNENRHLWRQLLTTSTSRLIGTHCEAKSSLWSDGEALLGFYQRSLAFRTKHEPEVRTATWQLRQFCKTDHLHLHVLHISTRATVQLVADAKKKHNHITCEVTPHHLVLDYYLAGFKDGYYRVSPPLRTFDDRKWLIWGLTTGVIDCIATDHAPHPRRLKTALPFSLAKPGFSGLETMFPVIYSFLIQPGLISWQVAVRATSSRPGAIINHHQTSIDVGHPANLVIVDVKNHRQVKATQLASASHSSPFQNWWLTGWPIYNIIRGRLYSLNR